MSVFVGPVIPYLLYSSLEGFINKKPRETIGELYGQYKNNAFYINYVFPMLDTKRSLNSVDMPSKKTTLHLEKNLEAFVEPNKRLGDFHTHLFTKKDDRNMFRSLKAYMKGIEEGSSYSKTDQKYMLEHIEDLYLIVGIAPKKFDIKQSHSSDGLSLIDQLDDYTFIISAWYWDDRLGEFQKRKVFY